MQPPLISILIPAFNVQDYIHECLESILSEIDPHSREIEIIACDDRSTDNTLAYIKHIQSRFPEHLKIIEHDTNKGVSEARNTLLNNSTGTYIWFIDADDRITNGALRSALKTLKEIQPDILSFDYADLTKENPQDPYKAGKHRSTFDGPTHRIITDRAIVATHLFSVGKFYVWSRIIKRSCWDKKLTFPPGRYYEDVAIIPAVLLHGKTFFHQPDIFIHYRKRPGSIQSTPSAKKFEDIAWAMSCMGKSIPTDFSWNEISLFERARFAARLFREASRKFIHANLPFESKQHQEFKNLFEQGAGIPASHLLRSLCMRGKLHQAIRYGYWFYLPVIPKISFRIKRLLRHENT